MQKKIYTVSDYLIDQLSKYGVRDVFGVPGDYVLSFFKKLENSKLKTIDTCDEQGAGFAADAYARINGLGVVCITYCVGGLKIVNTTAQAFAEKSPVIVISGAPGMNERKKKALLHHKVKDFDTQLKIFEQITVASTVLSDPSNACCEIERVIKAALKFKRPVYIELPRDVASMPIKLCEGRCEEEKESDLNVLKEALQETTKIINNAKKPVIVAGVELHRFGLQKELLLFLEKTGIPVVSTLLSKSIVRENHPQYLGVYEGAMGRETVAEYVETSDCLIMLGAFMTDINLGVFTAHIDQSKTISVTNEKTSIHYHTFEDILMKDFFVGLLDSKIKNRKVNLLPHSPIPEKLEPSKGKPMTVEYLFESLNVFLDDNTMVIADPGDAMFGSIDMTIHKAAEFMSPAYYTSLGFAVPASIGVQTCRPDLRSLVLVGDGSFQMTGMELATVARYKLNPIVIVLNNKGYGTERPMIDGEFNDVHLWEYSKIPEVLRAGKGFNVKTEDQLEEALRQAKANTKSFSILDVHLAVGDISKALKRLTSTLKKQIK
jgi:TPP-dependent 2-oxoacid decarboxylase